MKSGLPIIVFTLIGITLTACGAPPLARPENSRSAEQISNLAAPTGTVVGERISPLPTPTFTPLPSLATPTPFYTPVPQPSPTPTPTFEPLSDEPIMGFIFKPPEEIPSTRKIPGAEIIEWLPGSSDKVLLRGTFDLGVLDLSSGETTIYATVEEPGNLNPQPVWVPEAQGIAYDTWNLQTKRRNLWLGTAGGEKKMLLSDTAPPIIPLRIEGGVAAYSEEEQTIRAVTPGGDRVELATPLNRLPRSETGPPGSVYHIAMQSNGDWMAYYNRKNFLLFNFQTGELQPVDLGGAEPEPLWALNAKWSPNGMRLALMVTQGIPPIRFSDLYIMEWPLTKLYKIEQNSPYVAGIAWAPDSRHVLFEAVIGKKEGVNTNALFITNVDTTEVLPVPIPIEGLVASFSDSLSWSPDGKTILVRYLDASGNVLKQVEVTEIQ